jgi:Spy/CpxP family protein refolding chaperone
MQISKQYFMTALLVAGLGLSFAPHAKAQQPAPSQQQMEGALNAFENLPPEQRQQMMNKAMDVFKDMSEEEKQKLISEAKAHAQSLSDSQKAAYANEFQNVMTPEQKQKLMDQLKQAGVTQQSLQKNDTLAPPQNTNVDTLTQSLKNLTPEQRQKMIDALKKLNAGQQQ